MAGFDRVSIRQRLVFFSWVLTALLLSVLGLVSYFWYEKNQRDSLDSFLIGEADLITSKIESYFLARPETIPIVDLYGNKEFGAFLYDYFVRRGNRQFTYKTTLYVFDDKERYISSTNQALPLDPTKLNTEGTFFTDSQNINSFTNLVTVQTGQTTFRMITAPFFFNEQRLGNIRLACLLSATSSAVTSFGLNLAIVLAIAIVLNSFLAMFMIGRTLRPVKQMISAAEKISESNLSIRIPESPGKDEINQLALTLNNLLTRLERDFEFEERLVGELSHQLRTPLTILRGRNEVALGKLRTPKEYERLVEDNLADIDYLVALLNTMLTLARLESRIEKMRFEKKDLIPLLEEVTEDLVPLWEEKGIDVRFVYEGTSALFHSSLPAYGYVDPFRIKQAIMNILTNAYKFCPVQGGVIEVSLSKARLENHVVWRLVISNNGPPIPEESVDLVFKRFYRVEKVEPGVHLNKDSEHLTRGYGLGLSITKSLIELHSGKIRAFNPSKGGAAFEIELPAELPQKDDV